MPQYYINYDDLFETITVEGIKNHLDIKFKELDARREELLAEIEYLKNSKDIGLTFEEIKVKLSKASTEREECKKYKAELRKKFADGKIDIPKLPISEFQYYDVGGIKILPDDYLPNPEFEQKVFKLEEFMDSDSDLNLSDSERLQKRVDFYTNQVDICQDIDGYNTDYPKYLQVKHFYENFFQIKDSETFDEFYERIKRFIDIDYIKYEEGILVRLIINTKDKEYVVRVSSIHATLICIETNDTSVFEEYNIPVKLK